MSHPVDNFGYPTDPLMRQLELHMGKLAAYFRRALGNPERQEDIVREYHATMSKLYQLGWDGELEFHSHLPDEYMPEEYTRRNPETLTSSMDLKGWIDPTEFYKNKKARDKKE